MRKIVSSPLRVAALAATVLVAATTARADSDDVDLSAVALDIASASAIALSTVPGFVVEAELENEDGSMVWEMEVVAENGDEYELVIDAQSGSVIENELDD